jgi:hypothetical protein
MCGAIGMSIIICGSLVCDSGFERDRRLGGYTVTFPDFGYGATQGETDGKANNCPSRRTAAGQVPSGTATGSAIRQNRSLQRQLQDAVVRPRGKPQEHQAGSPRIVVWRFCEPSDDFI